jgi:hypothetical protein
MKMKTMKKAIAMFSMVAVSVATLGMNFAVAQTNVGTGLTADVSGGDAPIVKAKWEANADRYTDASTAAGAQLLPSGQYNVHKTVAICAVVTDPNGLADIDNVYADVFYPNVALGSSHVALPNQSGEGCGQFMQEDLLTRLSKADGIDLFCNKVRNLNNNLPTFNPVPTGLYNYDEICGATGQLAKDTAAVYCGEKQISYEDPSGDYEVWAIGQDKVGLQGVLTNHFTYLPMTAFETDFNQIAYGNVRLNTHKIIPGDLTWSPMNLGKATIRNVGNTRLAMKIWQNDMGLGKTSGQWNVKYDARIGSDSTYAVYFPETTNVLDDELDLSELDEMDFSIDISKFPPTHIGSTYTGTMVLSADAVAHLECQPE